jgi:cell division transport system ATP-binding protein
MFYFQEIIKKLRSEKEKTPNFLFFIFFVIIKKLIMIYLDKVSKIFKNTNYESVSDIDLNIEKGEFVGIIGPSGAGKTTILKLISGELQPSSGKIFFNSEDISTFKRSRLNKYRRNIGMIFQDFRLISNKTVFENIAFAMEVAGRRDKEIKKDVPHVLDLVGL